MPHLDSSLWSAEVTQKLPGDLRALIEAAELPSLGEGPRNQPLQESLRQGGPEVRTMSELCKSGLWLLAGDLEESHVISQSIENADGSFWHGIMHRREGDYSNAKYWFRRVGNHPVLQSLEETDYGDPFGFIDACSRAASGVSGDRGRLQELQWLEWQRLFVHCLESAELTAHKSPA